MSAYLTVRECAEQLAVHPWTAWSLIRRGVLPAIRVGRVYRVASSDLETFKRRALVVPPAPTVADRVGGVALIDAVMQRRNS